MGPVAVGEKYHISNLLVSSFAALCSPHIFQQLAVVISSIGCASLMQKIIEQNASPFEIGFVCNAGLRTAIVFLIAHSSFLELFMPGKHTSPWQYLVLKLCNQFLENFSRFYSFTSKQYYNHAFHSERLHLLYRHCDELVGSVKWPAFTSPNDLTRVY